MLLVHFTEVFILWPLTNENKPLNSLKAFGSIDIIDLTP